MINSLAELKAFQAKLRTLTAAFPFIQKKALEEVATDTVLQQIKRKMRIEDFSKKIIDATFVGKIEVFGNITKTHFISNYVAPENNFDVSNAREEGTRDHDVRPKEKGGTLRWFAKTGEVIFRKKSRPKGIERLLIIENTIKQNEGVATENYQSKLAEFVRNFLGV